MAKPKPEFPTLGALATVWVAHHCVVPDGFSAGKPFNYYGWQFDAVINHYRVRPKAKAPKFDRDDPGLIVQPGDLATAFHNRRSLIVGPQKSGKGPWSATVIALEAVGPVLFGGWAEPDEIYNCHDHGCLCPNPLVFEYGELAEHTDPIPRGVAWPTALIQLLATSSDQVDNVYRPLRSIALAPMLAPMMQVTEEMIRIRHGYSTGEPQIDVVTSSAKSRLGQPITFAMQDETGIYTQQNKMREVAETQRRGLAGMQGRAIETTNPWDITQDSVAQRTADAAARESDIYVQHREPPPELGDFAKPRSRRRILKYAYEGSPHVSIEAIDAEATELLATDPAQAERFFGNRIGSGSAKWTTPDEWNRHRDAIVVKRRERIVLGFDGSDGSATGHRVADSTVLRGCRLEDGYRFTLGVWEHEPDPETNEFGEWWVPRVDVMRKIRDAFARYKVVMLGMDPPYWRGELAELQEEFGEDRVIEWQTGNDRMMAGALERLGKSDSPHDGCPVTARHATNAVTMIKEHRDDVDGRRMLTLVTKPSKGSPQKIDGLISDAIALDLRDRAVASGARRKRRATLQTVN